MDLTFTGRGLPITQDLREAAEHRLARLSKLEPRATSIDLEFTSEHHPKLDGLKRVEASLRIPRKTFFAHAEAVEVTTALDDVAKKLERQLRDHHGKKRSRLHRGLESAHLSPGATDDTE
jgi:ribosomal subunit interface protein